LSQSWPALPKSLHEVHFVRGGPFSHEHGSLEREVFRSLHELQKTSPLSSHH
jgi:hypothetical protein